jgi:dephospho-CoA kinase
VIVIGVAGGIASGKSTVCQVFEGLGGVVINADRIGHEILDLPGIQETLIQAFGRQICRSDSTIDRKILGGIVFRDPLSRSRLDAIVHPALVAKIHKRIAELRVTDNVEVVIVDAALIVEWDEIDMVDTLLVLTAPESKRVEWLAARNDLTTDEGLQRISSQLTDEARCQSADHVLMNNGTVEELKAKAGDLWNRIVANQ